MIPKALTGRVPVPMRAREAFVAAGLSVVVADDHEGRYLVLEVPGRAGPCWVCAPTTDAALAAVRAGRASPWSIIHHSATGTVEIHRSMLDGTIRMSVVLCSSLPVGDALLSAA